MPIDKDSLVAAVARRVREDVEIASQEDAALVVRMAQEDAIRRILDAWTDAELHRMREDGLDEAFLDAFDRVMSESEKGEVN